MNLTEDQQDRVESIFLNWKQDLPEDFREEVAYEEYDASLSCVFFVYGGGEDAIDWDAINQLKEHLTEVSKELRVGCIGGPRTNLEDQKSL